MFDLRNFDLGQAARSVAGVAIPALIGGLAGGGKGALLGATSGLGGVLEGNFSRADRKRQEEAERAAIAKAFGPAPDIMVGPSPRINLKPDGTFGAQPNADMPPVDARPTGRDRLLDLANAAHSLRDSPLAPVLQGELQHQLSLDDPMSHGERLRSRDLDMSEMRMLQEQEQMAREQQAAEAQQARLAAMRESLPPGEQALFDIDPKGYAGHLMEQRFPEPMSPSDRFRVVGSDLVDVSGGSPEVAYRGRRNNEPLEQVYDPETGLTRYVPRSEAAQGIVPPKHGITVGQDENGNPVVQIGGGAQNASLGQKARNDVEAGLLSTQKGMDRLGMIMASHNPEFTTYQGAAKAAAFRQMNKLGVPVGDDQRQYLEDFTAWRQNVGNNLSQYVKEMSGTAASDKEREDLGKNLPSASDADIEFQSKAENKMREFKMVHARLAHIRKNGLSLNDFGGIGLDEMPAIIDQRGMQLEEQLRDAGLSGDQLDQALAQALREEFDL